MKMLVFFYDTFALKHLNYLNWVMIFFLIASSSPLSQQNKHSPDGNSREILFHARADFFRVTIEEKNCP